MNTEKEWGNGISDTELEQSEMDMIDNDNFHQEAVKAAMSIGLPEDEAELMVEDMGL